MHILLTNDDGIESPGLYCLREELKGLGKVSIVAPDNEQSAVGHSITLSSPLRVREVHRGGEFYGYGVDGAPADCVKLAFHEILDERPDIVVSGINSGANVGVNILSSGTVAAAIEGAFFEVPSLAVSLHALRGGNFDDAAVIAAEVVNLITENNLPRRTVLNVNIPAIPRSEIKGFKITHQTATLIDDGFERRVDPRGGAYYWVTGDIHADTDEDGSDLAVLQQGYVSIMPLRYDMTDYDLLETLKSKKWEKFQ